MSDPSAWSAVLAALLHMRLACEQTNEPAELELAAEDFLDVLAREMGFEGWAAESTPQLERAALEALIVYLDGESAKPDAGRAHDDALLLSAAAQLVLNYVVGELYPEPDTV
jgi:hypothetical protein